MKHFLAILIICLPLIFGLGSSGYSKYRKAECENCHMKPALFSFAFLAVHHSIPQHVCRAMSRQDLLTDPCNLITLCDSYVSRTNYCHWKIGHAGALWSYDNSAYTDAAFSKNKWRYKHDGE